MMARGTFRHGDLPNALVRAGLELAAAGGPDAVVLREATRRVGVVPNAAYRHFADRADLLGAVSGAAQGMLAGAIEEELSQVPDRGGRAATARARLRAVGKAYLAFAQCEPGLFRTAFSVPVDMGDANRAEHAGPGGRTPFQLIAGVLDELAAAGALPSADRRGAEFLAWSAVHGLATLVLDGPLRGLTDSEVDSAAERLLDMVERGLTTTTDIARKRKRPR